ncbi:GIN domain-containing protein [Bizionia sp. KMM 8389]
MKTIFKNCNIYVVLVMLFIGMISINNVQAQNKTFEVKHFDKVVVSPHLEVTFIAGTKESVIVEMLSESLEEINVVVKNKRLQIYLDDAKIITKKDVEKSQNNHNYDAYNGTVAKITVYYKKVKSFSLRGEERFLFSNAIVSDNMSFDIYGESQVTMKDVTLKDLKISIYGDSYILIENGSIENQRIIGYGESRVDLIDVNNKETKITAYGDGSYQCNVSDVLKIVSYGEPTIAYKGNAKLNQGLSIGEVNIIKIN